MNPPGGAQPPDGSSDRARSAASGFADHFSEKASDYAAFRPSYPRELFDHVVALAPARRLAWDVGTGNGQAAVALAGRFERVVATDASAEQIARATPHARVTYRIAREDDSGLPDGAVDLVTAAQSMHWFDVERFRREVERALRPDGVIAAWCYGPLQIGAPLDVVVAWFYERWVSRYWPAERRHVDTLYRELPFPFDELPAPPLAMTAAMDRREFLGYAGTWSAIARARRAGGLAPGDPRDPIAQLETRLAPLWTDARERRQVSWPIGIRIGRRRGSRREVV